MKFTVHHNIHSGQSTIHDESNCYQDVFTCDAPLAERIGAMLNASGTPLTASGLALRDHFAGLAMQVILAGRELCPDIDRAIHAYAMADAMLKARGNA